MYPRSSVAFITNFYMGLCSRATKFDHLKKVKKTSYIYIYNKFYNFLIKLIL